jgi:hypothetical protein
MRRAIALLLCAALMSGCATVGGPRFVVARQSTLSQPDPKLLADFVKQLPAGSRLKVDLTTGQHVKGTLMKASDTAIVIQPRTRVPEPPIEIALDRIVSVQLDPGNSIAKTFGIALAAGALGTLAVFAILLAAYGGD